MKEIAEILDEPAFDRIRALEGHRKALQGRRQRVDDMLSTIDKTIQHLKKETMLSHEELYRGLPKEQAAGWREEATQKWGKDAVERSEMRLLTMTREDLAALKEAFVENCGRLASMMDKDPADAEVQAAVGIHYGHIRQFWGTAGTPDPQLKAYQCLGEMYTQDDRYTMTDGKPNPAFAAFLCKAINCFVESR